MHLFCSPFRLSLGLLLWASLLAAMILPTVATATSARVVSSGSRSNPVIALTFDDASSSSSLQSIFNTLQSKGVPGTFFPTAQNMSATPGLWASIAAAGHPVGNHSLSHPQLTSLSNDGIRYEITKATSIIASITGRAPVNMLRPPYGAYNSRVAAIAGESGYSTLALWDVDPRDWSGISASDIVARTVPVARNGSVILLHAGPNNTAAALPQIIDGLQARGFSFATLPQLIGGGAVAPAPVAPPPPPPANPNPQPIAPVPPVAPVATPAPTPSPRIPMLVSMPTPKRPVSSRAIEPDPGALFGHGKFNWKLVLSEIQFWQSDLRQLR